MSIRSILRRKAVIGYLILLIGGGVGLWAIHHNSERLDKVECVERIILSERRTGPRGPHGRLIREERECKRDGAAFGSQR